MPIVINKMRENGLHGFERTEENTKFRCYFSLSTQSNSEHEWRKQWLEQHTDMHIDIESHRLLALYCARVETPNKCIDKYPNRNCVAVKMQRYEWEKNVNLRSERKNWNYMNVNVQIIIEKLEYTLESRTLLLHCKKRRNESNTFYWHHNKSHCNDAKWWEWMIIITRKIVHTASDWHATKVCMFFPLFFISLLSSLNMTDDADEAQPHTATAKWDKTKYGGNDCHKNHDEYNPRPSRQQATTATMTTTKTKKQIENKNFFVARVLVPQSEPSK